VVSELKHAQGQNGTDSQNNDLSRETTGPTEMKIFKVGDSENILFVIHSLTRMLSLVGELKVLCGYNPVRITCAELPTSLHNLLNHDTAQDTNVTSTAINYFSDEVFTSCRVTNSKITWSLLEVWMSQKQKCALDWISVFTALDLNS
jgi:hypothetical protein